MGSLNSTITKETNGNLTLRWTKDPAAKAYIITTPTGSALKGTGSTQSNLGKHDSISVQITPLYFDGANTETAVYPAVTPPPPPPAGGVDGVGVVRYAGSLPQTSHLGSYDIVIADWDQGALLAKQPGLSFAYRNMGPPGTAPIYPSRINDPDGFVNEVSAQVASHPGLDGVFIDNVSAGDKSWCLPFLANIGPRLKAQGVKVMLNAVASTGSGANDGSGDAAWYAQVGPYATHLMSELWMQGRGGSEIYRLRHRGSAHYSDYWDEWLKVPAAAHKAGCAFVGMTYGPLANAIYGRASLLLVAGPGDVFCWNPDTTPSGTDPYDPAWMKHLGAPVDAVGTNPRRFAAGTVTVDPVNATAVIQ